MRRGIGRDDRKQLLFFYCVDLVDDQDGGHVVLFDLVDQALLRRADVCDRLDNKRRHVHLGDRIGHDLAHIVAQTGARLVQAGRVQKDILRLALIQHARDARARGLGLVRYDGDLLADQLVCHGGFADIRPPDHGNDRCFGNFTHCILP